MVEGISPLFTASIFAVLVTSVWPERSRYDSGLTDYFRVLCQTGRVGGSGGPLVCVSVSVCASVSLIPLLLVLVLVLVF